MLTTARKLSSTIQRRISVKEIRQLCHLEPVIPEDRPATAATTGENEKDHGTPRMSSNESYEGEISSTSELLNMVEGRTKEKRKKLVSKFISALTLHGYAQFHEASGLRKVLWGLILAAMAVFIVRLTYLSYRSDNYYKQIIEFESEKVEEISFPTITICSFVPMYTQEQFKMFPINITEEEFKQFYYHVLSNRRNDPKTWGRMDQEEFESQILEKLYAKGYRTYTEVLQLFEKYQEKDINSLTVRKIMGRDKCQYEGRPCNFNKEFKTVYRHISQSLCKQFNFYKKDKIGLISTGNDRRNGLLMFLDISGEHYFDDNGMHGVLLEIHPYGTPQHIVDHRRTLYIEPGFISNIDLEQITTNRLPHPFKPYCKEQEPLIITKYPYSKATCEVECFMKKVEERCGCVPDQFAGYSSNARTCNVSEMSCAFLASLEVRCHKCPSKCSATDYNIFTSRLKLSNNWVYNSVKDSEEWKGKSRAEIMNYVNENIVGFRIGFRSLEKQMRTYKEAIPWYERMSMLGGILGLMLGFSVITGFELLFFIFDYIYITVKYRCTKEYLSAVLQQENLRTATQRRGDRMRRNHNGL